MHPSARQPQPYVTETIPTTVIRPTTSVLVLRITAATLTGILAIVGWALKLHALPICLGLMALTGLCGAAQAARGAVYVGPKGIRFRRGMDTLVVAWGDVYQFVAISRPWARDAAVDKVTSGFPIRYHLPAPKTSRIFADPAFDRDMARLRQWAGVTKPEATAPTAVGFGGRRSAFLGLLAIVLVCTFFDRPQSWIGGAEASTVPHACDTLSGLLSQSMSATTPTSADVDTTSTSMCTWALPGGQNISVSYRRFGRNGLHSSSDTANLRLTLQEFDDRTSTFEGIEYAHLGGTKLVDIPGKVMASSTEVDTLSRKGNVDVVLAMTYKTLTSENLTALGAATRAAVAAVQLH